MNVLRTIYYAFPPSLRRIVRRIWYLPLDIFEEITGRRDPMIPPRGRIFIGSGDYQRTGESIREQLVELAGLQPQHRVLDVGCGIGRVAVPLTSFLDEKGSYEGFDIVRSAITWCHKRISKPFPRFRFTHIDLRNDLYNLRTNSRASEFIFPYGDTEFDLVFLTSVFTHMVMEDVENYLDQIWRVLKPGGNCFATFFLMNQEARQFMKESRKEWFKTSLEHYYLFHPRVKEANVAFDEEYLAADMIKSRGFHLKEIRYGFWSGRPRSRLENYQDIIVFEKPESVDEIR
jgi:ubiquinone/menaquinone biosynthesis C-methylase UbiE